jgi:5'-3' exonuclease
MGICGLFNFLKKYEKIKTIENAVKDKNVGIDIFWFMHKSKGNICELEDMLQPIIKYSKTVHCVFDGKVPPEKKEYMKQQQLIRDEINKSITEIEKFINYPFSRISVEDRKYIIKYVNELKRRVWVPDFDYINSVKDLLFKKGCINYQAEYEADDNLAEMYKHNVIDLAVTNDSDLVVLGIKKIIRIKNKTCCGFYDVEHIQKCLNFNDEKWNHFIELCKTVDKKDIILAFTLVSLYNDFDIISKKYNDYSMDHKKYEQINNTYKNLII